MATLILLGVLLALAIVFVLLWMPALKLGLRWAGVPGGTWRRTALIACGALVFFVALWFGVGFVANRAGLTLEQMAYVALVAVLVHFAATWWGIARVFHVSYSRAVQAWLPTLAASGAFYAIQRFVIGALVFDTYIIPTNSMAPTVVGEHVTAKCPTCGAPAFGSSPEIDRSSAGRATLICSHFHTFKASEFDKTLGTPSRIVAFKLLKPRRWDLVVFRNPEFDEHNYLKRLIGLPGETVTIVDGSVYINGAKIDPPEELREITYVTELPDEPASHRAAVWGSPAKPAVLGPDEYFVLGDNTQRALDSRFWQSGAPGHPTYAVPESYMIGTATHLYWPPERVRVLR